MPTPRDPRKVEMLRKVFCLSDYSIRRVFRDFPEIADSPDLVQKLEYLAEHYPPFNRRRKSCSSLSWCGFLELTYDEFLFCAEAPDRMGFTEEDRDRYDRMVLEWDNPYDFRPLVPLLTMLCGPESASRIAKEMCFPAFYTSASKAQAIAERLLSYPGRISPFWVRYNWVNLFGRYMDPLRAFGELEARFRPAHLRKIIESRNDWGWIGYDLGPGINDGKTPDPQSAEEAFREMEQTFSACRKE